MKKIIITLIAAFALTACAQDAQSSYVDALAEFYKTSGKANAPENNDLLKETYVELTKNLVTNMSDFTANKLVDEYFKQHFLYDFALLQEPVMRRLISESELRMCLQMAKNSKFFKLKEKAIENGSAEFEIFIENLLAFYSGEKTNRPHYPYKNDSEFQQYFDPYFEYILQVESSTIDKIALSISSMAGNVSTEEARKDIIDGYKCIMYIKHHELISSDIMKEGLSIYETSEFQTLLKAINTVDSSHDDESLEKMMEYYTAFLRNKGYKLREL